VEAPLQRTITMKKPYLAVLAAFCVLSMAMPAVAGTIPHKAAGVSVWLPDDWKSSTEEENVLELFNGADADSSEAYMYFWVVEGDDVKDAAGEVDEDIAKWVKNVKWEKQPTEGTINGMSATMLEGTATAVEGKYSGKAVDIAVAFVVTPKKKIVLVYGEFLKGGPQAAKLDKDVLKIIQGIKPL
jgi:hypothetical protein